MSSWFHARKYGDEQVEEHDVADDEVENQHGHHHPRVVLGVLTHAGGVAHGERLAVGGVADVLVASCGCKVTV